VTFTAPPEAVGVSRSTGIEFTQDGQSMTIAGFPPKVDARTFDFDSVLRLDLHVLILEIPNRPKMY
jgi:hypothetical protein